MDKVSATFLIPILGNSLYSFYPATLHVQLGYSSPNRFDIDKNGTSTAETVSFQYWFQVWNDDETAVSIQILKLGVLRVETAVFEYLTQY